MYSEKLFRGTKKKTISEKAQRYFALVLSQMDLGSVDTWKMKVFV